MQSLLQGTGGSVAHALAELADVPGSDLAMVSYGVAAFVVGRCAKKRALVDAAIALGAGGAWCWALTKAGQLVLVCWSRVHLGEHFVWNVMLGFAVGTFTGRRRNPLTRTES